ncbi:endonuclease MutS2 [Priestia koreensis]|uniref:endonuclease MutS2 n=1 Tax=Priestia koreensis TaxID=284581 RepID=UPI0020405543|nr:endonuclease MutS2 [Priestia koreensis]MCM3005445.1 endonuclease MutS2 [Priestia koreensis]
MNERAYSVLEYNRVKEDVARFAMTEEGKEQILGLLPSTNKRQLQAQLAEVTEAVAILEKSASVPLSGLSGMSVLMKQLHKGTALKVDTLSKLLGFLDSCAKLKRFMKDKQYLAPRVSLYVDGMDDLSAIADEIVRCIRNGRVDDYASKELLKIRRQLETHEQKLKEKLQQMVKSSKYKAYLQESTINERNGRYAVAVKKEYKSKVKGAILDTSSSGSTLYIEPEEASSIQDLIELQKAMEEVEVERILFSLTALVEENEQSLKGSIETMIHYDVLFAKGKHSQLINGREVAINEESRVLLKEARHPLLGDGAVPLTVEIGTEYRNLVITGPNTGGKTVTIKTVGLLVMMVQSGLHVPVNEGSEVAMFKQILVDIGDGQSIEQSLSTFSSHLTNIIEILKEANEYTLVLVDELGSGTDPSEGMGLATAILHQLAKKGVTMLATTHYSEIKEFADATEGFRNGSMEFDIHTLKPTYRLLIGKGGESQAFAIALKLGLHPRIIEEAHRITYREEKEYPLGSIENQKELDKQIIINRHAHQKTGKPQQATATIFVQGDNVRITQSDEFGIVYSGPDSFGNYVVQVKEEKRTYNHKRLKLYISRDELYPDDYDFSIVFDSKENRKKERLISRKYVEGLVIERDEEE